MELGSEILVTACYTSEFGCARLVKPKSLGPSPAAAPTDASSDLSDIKKEDVSLLRSLKVNAVYRFYQCPQLTGWVRNSSVNDFSGKKPEPHDSTYSAEGDTGY